MYFLQRLQAGIRGLALVWTAMLLAGSGLRAVAQELVKDIRERDAALDLFPQLRAVIGDKVVFAANDVVHGQELWVSDGTTTGTRLLKDILPGPESSFAAPPGSQRWAVSGSRLFFAALNGSGNCELWVTDGTEGGTRLVFGQGEWPQMMVSCGPGILFKSPGGSAQNWKLGWSDGTSAGTRMMDINVNINDVLDSTGEVGVLFQLNQAGAAHVLRTVRTTQPPLALTTVLELPGKMHQSLGAENGTLSFLLRQASGDLELWKTDGTLAGTGAVKLLARNHSDGPAGTPCFARAGDRLYFTASASNDGTGLHELWVTDGTGAGTLRVQQTAQGVPAAAVFDALVGWGDKLVGRYHTFPAGLYGVWLYDPATGQGQVIYEGGSASQIVQRLACTGSRIFFATAASRTQPGAVWVSDGTPGGTVPAAPGMGLGGGIVWNPVRSSAQQQANDFSSYILLPKGEDVFLLASSAEAGAELWKTNGREGGTVRLTDVRLADSDSSPRYLRAVGGHVYFSADDGERGRELWRTDGTAGGTQLVADICAGSGSSSPREMTEMGGQIYFFAQDAIGNRGLWRTDGTSDGTVLVRSFGYSETEPTQMTAVGSKLFFTAARRGDSVRLWSSDGTAGGTVTNYLAPISPDELSAMDGQLYFTALDYDYMPRLYRLDPASPDTPPVLLLTSSRVVSVPRNLVVRPPSPGALVEPDRHVLYLSDGPELWRCCNGEAPVLVHAFPTSQNWIERLLLHGDEVFMQLAGGSDLLWRSNGTSEGTTPLGIPYAAQIMKIVGDRIYFHRRGYSGSPSGLGCSRLDGSDPRTLIPFGPAIYVLPVHVEGDTVFVARSDYGSAWTLWSTQGTPESTRQVSPLPLSIPVTDSSPGEIPPEHAMARVGNKLCFCAEDGFLGEELYAQDLSGSLVVREVPETILVPPKVLPVLRFPLTVVGQEATVRSFVLENVGYLPLMDITAVLPEGADYAVSPAAISSLAPGEKVRVSVSFQPQDPGGAQTTLTIHATGTTASETSLALRGDVLGLNDGPLMVNELSPAIILAGQSLTLAPEFLSASAYTSIIWEKDFKAVPGVTGTSDDPLSLVRAPAQLSDAGLYQLTVTNAIEPAHTDLIPIAILLPALEAAAVNEGGALTLSCTGRAPVNHTLQYQWRRNGDALTDSQILKGSRSAVLKIARLELTDAGAYDCLVTLATAAGPVMDGAVPVSRSAGLTNVTVNARPRVLAPAEPLTWLIGEAVSYQVQTDLPAISLTAKGLPPGLKMSKTGLITGQPTRSFNSDAAGAFLPFQVTVTATNAVGAGPAGMLPIQIRAFMPAGGYDCLLDPIDTVTHGSHLKFTVSSTGALSGQLLHGGKTRRFTSSQLKPAPGPGTNYLLDLSAKNAPLTVTLHAPEAEALPWAATLTQGELGSVQAHCRRHLFSSTRPATALAGAYTWSMMAPGHEESPAGTGFMTATVARTGIVNWKGRLADGTAVTGSNALASFAGGGVDLPVHADLYKLTGALHGAAVFGLGETSVTLSGSFFWDKDALPETSKERNYKAGFARHEVAVEGSRYEAPAAGEYLFGIVRGDLNAQVDLSGGDMGVTQGIELSVKHTVSLSAPTLSNGLFLKSLSFSVKTGTFKGSVLLLHESDPKLNRTATFEGLILSHEKVGRGFMLLPELPAEGQPASVIKTTPLRSVTVTVSAM